MAKKKDSDARGIEVWSSNSRKVQEQKQKQERKRKQDLRQLAERVVEKPMPAIVLVSKRGIRKLIPKKRCDECRKLPPEGKSLMHYSKSNVGPVAICDLCLGKVQDRSWRPLDTLDYSWGGGSFSPK
ncbi:MAG: hypothetical protein KME47_16510 [Nodosilinea sp. WJT8-NPBG4]|jgi:hypothetical protein|nr:hypothetical protein [Nodosilinea sp. WJT8-NPBG4]